MTTVSLKDLNKELSKISKELNSKMKELPNGVIRELTIGANLIRNTIILSMRNTPKTGREYRRGSKSHIASSPGKPPAIDRGELVRSIMYDIREMEVEIGNEAGAPYGSYLEEGTKNIEPRPWLEPAVNKHKNNILKNITGVCIDIVKKPLE